MTEARASPFELKDIANEIGVALRQVEGLRITSDASVAALQARGFTTRQIADTLGLTMLVVLAAVLVWTSPNRWGVGIALHYLSRVYWPDPADPIPPPSA